MRNRAGQVLWRWRRNPLRRRSDIAEAWLVVAVATLLLLTVPIAAVATAVVAEHAALDQARGLHRTTAHLVEDAPAVATRFSDLAAEDRVNARVRWTTPSGTSRTGKALVPAGRKAGAPATVWLDDTGRIRPAPPTSSQVRSQAAAFGVAAGVGACVLVLGLWWGARVRLDAHRRAQWDCAWAAFNAHQGNRQA
ncbi:hypothetical protein ABZ915_40340 [Streptomyces sp. NPDC046915]|uniref:Rv1733c family protein n=1 Tax=Streptomyces sp. NPDC046915 TaxID=3155257 RepID=UPI0033DFA8BD